MKKIEILFFCVFFIILTSCHISKSSSLAKTTERQKLDSLVLVKKIPINIFSQDSVYKSEFQQMLANTLQKKGYTVIDAQKSSALLKENFAYQFGATNPIRNKEVTEKILEDKDYLNRQIERAEPFLQRIQLLPCLNDEKECIMIRRYNEPNYKKKRVWILKYEEAEPINNFLNRIVDSLTAEKPYKL